MVRQIIHIDEDKCNGCGLCAEACHESAIAIVDGKARLIRDDYCDGMGDCLPNCPTGAITFETREAAPYDEAAVEANKQKNLERKAAAGFHGCPGTAMRQINRAADQVSVSGADMPSDNAPVLRADMPLDNAYVLRTDMPAVMTSQLKNWPVQIKLAPLKAPYFSGAKLLIAADCTAYAYANFHREFIKGKMTLIGCPKLDNIDYSEKLTEIIRNNDIKEVTIVRMEVPCCGGLENAAKKAIQASGKFMPWQVVTISIDGRILD